MCGVHFESGSIAVPDAMERAIAHKVEWLGSQYPELNDCGVEVTGPEKHRRDRPYRIRLALHAGNAWVTAAGRADNQLSAAFSSALDAARRKLEDRARRHGRHVLT